MYWLKNPFKSTTKVVDVIEKIHSEFDTASERILSEAKEIISNSDNQAKEKAERLKNIGFGSSKLVTEIAKQVKAERESKEVAENIVYFQTWYPNNKFITEKEVERICKKYSLVCGQSQYYIGDIPEKNLREIEAFKIREEDKKTEYYGDRRYFSGLLSGYGNIVNPFSQREEPRSYKYQPPFQICAPAKDFDTKNMIISKGYKLQHIPDPIVLQPVKGGYLIVSKWGLEGEDKDLVNEKMN